MSKRLLAVFAHPDDEAFGPGGTLAKYASEGVEIHLLCATRGEAGDDNRIKNHESRIKNKNTFISEAREDELLASAKTLGVREVEFLDFVDGTLSNSMYHQLGDKIIAKINTFKPHVIVTFDQNGISGHLDHIAVSMITTYAFHKTDVAKKLYYLCLLDEMRDKSLDKYFIYFPEGYSQSQITTRIDYSNHWDTKIAAMRQHESQMKDVIRILKRIRTFPKVDYYILKYYRDVTVRLPETDLFAGIAH